MFSWLGSEVFSEPRARLVSYVNYTDKTISYLQREYGAKLTIKSSSLQNAAAHRDLEICLAVVKLQKTRMTYFKVKTYFLF